MITQLAYYSIGGMPMIAIGGTLTFLAFMFTAYIGWAVMKGKTRIPLKWHMRMAGISLALAFIHGLLGLAIFLGL